MIFMKYPLVMFTVFFLAGFIISCNPSATSSKVLAKKGIITKVSDGDSVDFFDGTDTLKIRLQHIDAPERNQPFSTESWRFLRNLIHKKEVNLHSDYTQDRYGRIIGVLFLDAQNVNKTLVEQGYAWHFKRYSNDVAYAALELEAKQQKKGLWREENPIAPWQWRK